MSHLGNSAVVPARCSLGKGFSKSANEKHLLLKNRTGWVLVPIIAQRIKTQEKESARTEEKRELT